MNEITGYETGVARVCPWCWEQTTHLGVDEFSGLVIPLHVTCAMQMLLIRRKLEHGRWVRRRPGPLTVAWRRFFRMQRTNRRKAKATQRLDRQRRLMLTSGDGTRHHGQGLQGPRPVTRSE